MASYPTLLLCATVLFLGVPTCSTAQVDLNAILRQTGEQGIAVQEDNAPFVPNLFIGSFTLEMHLFRGAQEEPHSPLFTSITNSRDKTLLTTRHPGSVMDTRVLTDLKDKWQYILVDDGQGAKTAMKMRRLMVDAGQGLQLAGDARMTDETKVIDGHMCRKMTSRNEEGTWTGWLAGDLEIPFAEVMRGLQGQGPNDRSQEIAGVHGFPLEYEWVSADGSERIVCHIRNLKQGAPDEGVFSLEDHQVIEVPPGFGAPGR